MAFVLYSMLDSVGMNASKASANHVQDVRDRENGRVLVEACHTSARPSSFRETFSHSQQFRIQTSPHNKGLPGRCGIED